MKQIVIFLLLMCGTMLVCAQSDNIRRNKSNVKVEMPKSVSSLRRLTSKTTPKKSITSKKTNKTEERTSSKKMDFWDSYYKKYGMPENATLDEWIDLYEKNVAIVTSDTTNTFLSAFCAINEISAFIMQKHPEFQRINNLIYNLAAANQLCEKFYGITHSILPKQYYTKLFYRLSSKEERSKEEDMWYSYAAIYLAISYLDTEDYKRATKYAKVALDYADYKSAGQQILDSCKNMTQQTFEFADNDGDEMEELIKIANDKYTMYTSLADTIAIKNVLGLDLINVYTDIERKFPSYRDMGNVLYRHFSVANSLEKSPQTGLARIPALKLYNRLTTKLRTEDEMLYCAVTAQYLANFYFFNEEYDNARQYAKAMLEYDLTNNIGQTILDAMDKHHK